MKIKNVKLTNFRQFYGEQDLSFSTCEQNRVTVIHAENSYGKTTLLNAILWCFFEDTTTKFENKRDIISWEAVNDGIEECSVTVTIDHIGHDYILKRTYYSNRKQSDFTGFKVVNGNFEKLMSPSNFINSVIPREMAKYFFFDGEAAENFSAEKNHNAVSDAIKAMLGCSLASTAIEDLGTVNRKFSNQIPKDKASSNDNLNEDLETTEKVLKEIEDEIIYLEKQAEYHARKKDEYASKLKDNAESKKIDEERRRKKNEKKELEERIKFYRRNIGDWISSDGLSIIARRASEQAITLLEDASVKGKVPSPYNEDLVNKILEENICICGRELEEGSAPWRRILDMLNSASKKETQNRMIKMRAYATSLIDRAKRAHSLLNDMNTRTKRDIHYRDQLEAEISALDQRLTNFNVDEIAELEKARREADSRESSTREKIGKLKANRSQLETRNKTLQIQLEKKAKEDVRIRKIATRKKLIQKATELLSSLLETYQKDAREQVEKQVNIILEIVSHNHRKCRFNEGFSLELVNSDGRPCPKSSGESQLLSLVFMAALVEFSARRINDTSLLLKPGASAPLILDSPFGQLDVQYQQETAGCLPTFAEQVVLFLSSTQGNEKVLKILEPHIGSEYVLVSHSKEDQGKKKATVVERRGERYITKRFSSTHDKTEVLEIMNASR